MRERTFLNISTVPGILFLFLGGIESIFDSRLKEVRSAQPGGGEIVGGEFVF